jgi:hypothetical protein
MKTKTIGFIVGSLGLLVGVGSAHAQDQAAPVTGGDAAGVPAAAPMCRDMGVTVSFKTDSYELDLNGRGALDGVATWMKNDSTRTLNLRGYADTTGNSEANLMLSQHRADSVKAYLVTQGIDPARILTAGRGEIAEHQEHLPADGRTVTFMGCKQAPPVAEAPAAEEPAPVAEVPPPPPAPEIYPVTPPPSAPEGATYAPYGSKFGWAFLAGGGFQDFTKSVMRAQTNAGGAWDLRLVGGTKSIIGFEAAYVGSARTIQTLGFTANTPSLVSNGAEGTIRLNAPIVRGASLIEPYIFGGVGWTHYSITNFNANTAITSDFTRTDDVMTVPAGAGFAYGYKGFMIDVRGNYTPTYFNNLLANTSTTGTLNTWGVGGQVGFLF